MNILLWISQQVDYPRAMGSSFLSPANFSASSLNHPVSDWQFISQVHLPNSYDFTDKYLINHLSLGLETNSLAVDT
jgi:hypothetical protein